MTEQAIMNLVPFEDAVSRFDPVIGLGIAAAAIWQGVKSWRGEDCGC